MVEEAFERAGSELRTGYDLRTARRSLNLLFADWANRGVNLWAVDLITVPLVQGQATYNVDPSTVVMLDAYMGIVNGSVETDRIILPISRSEYANYPNKSQQASLPPSGLTA